MADTLESTIGIRCLRLSYDGKHLACGLRNGNIIVFELSNLKFNLVCPPIEAHEQEVRCLEYSDPNCKHILLAFKLSIVNLGGHHFLASGSRDRLVHLFDVNNNYSHLSVIEDHQSTVNSINFNFVSFFLEIL